MRKNYVQTQKKYRICNEASMLIYILKKNPKKVAIVTCRLQKFSQSDVLDSGNSQLAWHVSLVLWIKA